MLERAKGFFGVKKDTAPQKAKVEAVEVKVDLTIDTLPFVVNRPTVSQLAKVEQKLNSDGINNSDAQSVFDRTKAFLQEKRETIESLKRVRTERVLPVFNVGQARSDMEVVRKLEDRRVVIEKEIGASLAFFNDAGIEVDPSQMPSKLFDKAKAGISNVSMSVGEGVKTRIRRTGEVVFNSLGEKGRVLSAGEKIGRGEKAVQRGIEQISATSILLDKLGTTPDFVNFFDITESLTAKGKSSIKMKINDQGRNMAQGIYEALFSTLESPTLIIEEIKKFRGLDEKGRYADTAIQKLFPKQFFPSSELQVKAVKSILNNVLLRARNAEKAASKRQTASALAQNENIVDLNQVIVEKTGKSVLEYAEKTWQRMGLSKKEIGKRLKLFKGISATNKNLRYAGYSLTGLTLLTALAFGAVTNAGSTKSSDYVPRPSGIHMSGHGNIEGAFIGDRSVGTPITVYSSGRGDIQGAFIGDNIVELRSAHTGRIPTHGGREVPEEAPNGIAVWDKSGIEVSPTHIPDLATVQSDVIAQIEIGKPVGEQVFKLMPEASLEQRLDIYRKVLESKKENFMETAEAIVNNKDGAYSPALIAAAQLQLDTINKLSKDSSALNTMDIKDAFNQISKAIHFWHP